MFIKVGKSITIDACDFSYNNTGYLMSKYQTTPIFDN